MEYGIDISENNGKIDFNEVIKAGNSFVIIKVGTGQSLLNKDNCFERNYYYAKINGLKVGGYWDLQARTVNQALIEGRICLTVIKSKQFEYPVYVAIREKYYHDFNQSLSVIVETFCMVLESQAYYAGVYASKAYFKEKLVNIQNVFDKWVIDDKNDGDVNELDYKMYQYPNKYYFNQSYINQNVVYDFDYPVIIKKAHLNNW